MVRAGLFIAMGLASACCVWFGLHVRDERRARRLFDNNRKSVSARPWAYVRAFPDFLELLALALSSGCTLDRAWEEALRFLPEGPLRSELRRVSNDFSLGRSRVDAIRALMGRLNNDRLGGTLALLCHSLKYGTPLEGILLEQARSLREAALMAVEKRAQTASLRLLFPLVFFILPTIFIILFGPLVLGFIETGRLF